MNTIPEDAAVLPDKENAYIAVWQTDKSLCINLLKSGGFVVQLDKRVIPYLANALLLNCKTRDKMQDI